MTIDTTRLGFLAGLFGAAVIAVVPKSAQAVIAPHIPALDPWSIKAPPGWTYQWVRCALLGDPDPANVEARLSNGWSFVKPETYPGAPVSTAERAIAACGLILMEKPTAAVQAAIQAENDEADKKFPGRVALRQSKERARLTGGVPTIDATVKGDGSLRDEPIETIRSGFDT